MMLTESFAMLPTAAVSGYYFAHPEAQYFGVARIGDQLGGTTPGAAACRSSRPNDGCGRTSAIEAFIPSKRHWEVPFGDGGRNRTSVRRRFPLMTRDPSVPYDGYLPAKLGKK